MLTMVTFFDKYHVTTCNIGFKNGKSFNYHGQLETQ